ncbi:MAG TPA: ABC transporter permease [Flavisolibacter sp.]|nr:ABC transporter permease [Flavisolibacter sp.]
MLTNYLTIAWRNIRRNKAFSITNLLGLALGMTSTIFIVLWVWDEMNWNHFHQNHAQVYQVRVNRDFNGEITTEDAVPFPLAEAMKRELPEVKYTATDDFGRERVLNHNETILRSRGYTVAPGYFDLFRWQFVKGRSAAALAAPSSIIISEATAKALFANSDPIGKTIKMDNAVNMTVTGVVKDPPPSSTIQFGFIVPFDYTNADTKRLSSDWVNCFTQAFIEVRPGTDIKKLQQKIEAIYARNNGNKAEFLLHPMDKWRLYSDFRNGKNVGGMIAYVKLFSIVAIIILLIACVNFMNLSTAKSEKRAKEVGIRKTLGSGRRQLLLQFFGESLIFSLLAFLLSVAAVYILLPSFNQLIGKQLSLNWTDPFFLMVSAGIVVFTGLVAGSYPALYLSSFRPVKVLKGSFLPGRRAAIPRKVLVVLQFAISVLLISATILVYQQLQHVKNRDLGYDQENLISIPSSDNANRNADVIKNELAQSGFVAAVTRTSSPLTQIWNFTPAPDWKGKPADSKIIMAAMRADGGFAATVGTKLLAGRDFTGGPADSNAMLLNKAAVDLMQLKDPVGQEMRYGRRLYRVVGVTDNLVMNSPFTPVMPMMTFSDRSGGGFFILRLKQGVQLRAALDRVEAIFKKHNPGYPFDYGFIDEQFSQKFQTEDMMGRLINLFAGLAIFICCLGLSGLTAFTIEKRFKEISIRKVLGASALQLLSLISREFLLLVLLAAIISIPAAWWLLHNWLQDYEYRINISIWVFIASCAGVMLLTLAVVWMNAARAALSKPVKSLRSE